MNGETRPVRDSTGNERGLDGRDAPGASASIANDDSLFRFDVGTTLQEKHGVTKVDKAATSGLTCGLSSRESWIRYPCISKLFEILSAKLGKYV